jgi:hypothetical protein
MKLVTIFLLLIFVGHPAIALPQESKSKVEKIFHDYVQLNTIFIASAQKDSPSKKAYQDLRRAVETYGEDVYNPILKDAVSIVCNNKDKQILYEYFQVIVHTRNSADEYPTFILGEMFICQTEIFTEIYKKLPVTEKATIYEAVEWGFQNITYQKESEISEYSELKKKLEQLKNL